MVESQQVLEWINEGKIKGQIKAKVQTLLRLLEKKFPPGAAADLVGTIKACTDLDCLSRWFDAAIDASSLEEFHKAIRQ